MLNLGPEKILAVLVIALIVLGPEKLPDAARNVGRLYREFKRMTSGLQAEVRETFAEPLAEVRSLFEEPSVPAPTAPGTSPDDPIWRQQAEDTDEAQQAGGLPVFPAESGPPPSSPLVFQPGDPNLN